MYHRVSLVFVVLASVITACGGSEKKPAASAVTESTPAAANNPKPDDDATKGMVNVSDDVKKACGLSDDEAHFAFNSAAVTPKDNVVLKKLADCFETGPLKGKKMDLVGHADPRGADDYNMALGGRRADNVKSVMVSLGLSSGNVVTSSRGKMDATGTDEASWAKDRKVDVNIAR
jgi:outer membrane protein OmpA-like peptidoglycan-associated protein